MALTPETIAARSGRIFTAIFVACVLVLGSAVYIQQVERIFPCPWCVVQRLGYLLVGLIALVAVLHRPKSGGMRVYARLGVLASLAGASAALYQVFLERDPVRAQSCIGGVVEKVLDTIEIGKLFPMLLQYDGPCGDTGWRLLSLSVPQWSLIGFLLLAATFFFTPYAVERAK